MTWKVTGRRVVVTTRDEKASDDEAKKKNLQLFLFVVKRIFVRVVIGEGEFSHWSKRRAVGALLCSNRTQNLPTDGLVLVVRCAAFFLVRQAFPALKQVSRAQPYGIVCKQ